MAGALGAWAADLSHRLQFFGGWLARGAPPAEYWLPAFFSPNAFLTAVLQTHARSHGLPIGALRFEHRVLTARVKKRDPPPTGVHVYGLFLEGAGWHPKDKCLCEAPPKELVVEMNVLWFDPTSKPPIAPAGGGGYDCPVYKTSARGGGGGGGGGDAGGGGGGFGDQLVCFVRLPTPSVGEVHWVKRSVALVCSLDD